MANSAIRHILYTINTSYYDYFVTDRHPIVATITEIIFWLLWAAIVVAFFSLLYYNHWIIFISIIAAFAIIEIIYQVAK